MTLACLLAGVLLSAGAGADDAAKELEKLQGTWTVTIVELDGKPATDEQKKRVSQLVVKGDKYTILVDGKKIDGGTLKVDPAKKPKVMDATPEEGPLKGKALAGVYELEGDDMKVCFAQPDKDRPTELKTKAGTLQILFSYKRVKP